ncbi:MAG: hypothetical protein JO066_05425, partial [Verrucomicrobia bacterium]|nr:hypothetical protein [Verrucomicrobiota bacterium]
MSSKHEDQVEALGHWSDEQLAKRGGVQASAEEQSQDKQEVPQPDKGEIP